MFITVTKCLIKINRLSKLYFYPIVSKFLIVSKLWSVQQQKCMIFNGESICCAPHNSERQSIFLINQIYDNSYIRGEGVENDDRYHNFSSQSLIRGAYLEGILHTSPNNQPLGQKLHIHVPDFVLKFSPNFHILVYFFCP